MIAYELSLVTVINGFVLFSTGMRITTFDFCAPVNKVFVIMSCWEFDIESPSAVHDNSKKKCCTMYSKKKSISSQIVSLLS